MARVILFRAQPYHLGHKRMISEALLDAQKYNEDLYIFVGSADKVGTKRNPLPILLRTTIIKEDLQSDLSEDEFKQVHILELDDLTDEADNSYDWGQYLYDHIVNITGEDEFVIYYSDNPSIMLSWFNNELRNKICFKFLGRYNDISATKVRKAFLEDNWLFAIKNLVPDSTYIRGSAIRNYILKSLEEK